MPRFYFHFISQGQVTTDDVGLVFPSLEAAYLDSYNAALDISMERLQARDDPTDDRIEIAGEDGRTLMQIPFTEVLRPGKKSNIQAKTTTGRAIQACRRQMLRNDILRGEIQSEFEKTRSAFQSIQAKLATLKAGRWPD